MAQALALPLQDTRSAEILALVRKAFAEKGFDGTSMQDLARAAGMSVGNFYRYFPSKAAIVEGLIGADLEEMQQRFAEVALDAHPMACLRRMIRDRIPLHQCCDDGQIWAEITAAALRKPEIAATAQRMEATIIANLTALFALETGLSLDEAHQRFAAHAAFIVLLFKSSAMIKPDAKPQGADLTEMIIRTIENTLDTVSKAKKA